MLLKLDCNTCHYLRPSVFTYLKILIRVIINVFVSCVVVSESESVLGSRNRSKSLVKGGKIETKGNPVLL